MGDRGLDRWEHEPAPAHGVTSPPIAYPYDVAGPLGAMTIVPDGYAGAKPAGAVSEQDYARMVEVYGHIESGHSQLQLDSSAYFQGADGQPIDPLAHPLDYMQALIKAQQFRTESMGYLRDLVKTQAGLELLSELDTSRHTTTLAGDAYGDSVDAAHDHDAHRDAYGMRGKGSDATVHFEADDHGTCMTQACNANAPWTHDGPRFELYNNLVHAYHYTRGDAATGTHGRDASGNAIGNEDWEAAGLGPGAVGPVSENRIRSQMHAPLRPTVGDVTYERSARRP